MTTLKNKIKKEELDIQLGVLKSPSTREVYDALSECLTLFTPKRITPKFLITFSGTNNRDECYTKSYIPKKRGGIRKISIPSKPLKVIQKAILNFLYNICSPHKTAKGFIPEESIISNAKLHKNKKMIYNLDIDNFFPSISSKRIYGMFLSYPFDFNKETSRILTNLTTYEGSLPQGAPTSPYISNILCRKLDARLYGYAIKNDIVYSRYADDLTFSTNKPKGFSSSDKEIINGIIIEEGFKINERKTRFIPYYKRQLVTGIVVNKKLNVGREYFRSLRAILHNVEKYGWQSQVSRLLMPTLEKKLKLDISSNNILEGEIRKHYSENSFSNLISYKNSLSKKEFNNIIELQGKKNYLLDVLSADFNPLIVNYNVQKSIIDRFQKVLYGRIEFISQVRGKNDKKYLKLKDKLDWLVNLEELSLEEAKKVKELIIKSDSELIKKKKEYSINKKKIEESTVEELDKLAKIWAERFLEFNWVSITSLEEKKKEILTMYFSTLLSPKTTGSFLSYFNNGLFDGLIHDTQINIEPKKLLADSEGVFNAFNKLLLLPNALKSDFKTFLSKYRSFILESDSVHPWQDLSFRNDDIIPFRKKFRFDEGDDQAFDLIKRLEEYKKDINNQFANKTINITSDFCPKFYSHTRSVWFAIEKIIYSMVSNNAHGGPVSIKIDSLEVDNSIKTNITIFDNDGIIGKKPELKMFFGNKLRQALVSLRGLAEWNLAAPFEDGCCYQFDVMHNSRTSLSHQISGVKHDLNFYS